jgi:hypothetical protein
MEGKQKSINQQNTTWGWEELGSGRQKGTLNGAGGSWSRKKGKSKAHSAKAAPGAPGEGHSVRPDQLGCGDRRETEEK